MAALGAKTYKVNTQHSFINFELPYMMVSTVKGNFESFSGTFEFLPEENVVRDIKLTILANSINTRDAKRDQHLNRSDFFHTSKYKEITFQSKFLPLRKGEAIRGRGILTIKGISKPLNFSIKSNGILRDPIDKNKVGLFLKITGNLNRKDYGINWNKALDTGGVLVGDKVAFSFIVEANPVDAKPAFSRFLKNTKGTRLSKKLAQEHGIFENSKEPGLGINIKKKVANKPYDIVHDNNLQKSFKEKKSYKVFVDLVIGFLLFLLLIFVGGIVKKYLHEFLQIRLSEGKSDFISDIFLYTFITVAAVYLAPFMGYTTY